MKEWVKKDGVSIHLMKMAFDLDCTKGQVRHMDKTILDANRESVESHGIIGMVQCHLVDQGGACMCVLLLCVPWREQTLTMNDQIRPFPLFICLTDDSYIVLGGQHIAAVLLEVYRKRMATI